MTTSYGYVLPRKSWLTRNKVMVAVAAVAVAIGAVVAVIVSRGPSGPPAYLATSANQVKFITWQQAGNGIQGTIAGDSITGAPPNETVSVQSVPFTGSIDGSTVTITVNGGFLIGTRTLTATLNGSTLSIGFVGSNGSFRTDNLTQSSVSAYNAAVAALHNRVHRANVLAAQQQAQAAQQQKRAQDEQTAQNDIATLQQDANFINDLSALAGDAKQANKDLGTVQADAAHGNGRYCDNLIQVGDDAIIVDDDAITLSDDLITLTDDFHTVHANMAAVEADLQTLASDGMTAPAEASSAIAAAHTAITQAKATANVDITQVDAIDKQAFAIGNAMATGSCSGQGPGSPSSLVPHIH